jgi:hypothetical protein
MMGEFRLDLGRLTGKMGSMVAHIADIPERAYNVILGTDVLRPYRGYPRYKKGQWRIKIGTRSFRARGFVNMTEQLGATIVTGTLECELSEEEKSLVDSFGEDTYREGDTRRRRGGSSTR